MSMKILAPNNLNEIKDKPEWLVSTRHKSMKLEQKSKPTGGGLTIHDIPPVGIITEIHLSIRVTITGSLSNPNAHGLASCIRKCTLKINSGTNIFDLSGAGYHWVLREVLYDARERGSYTAGRNAVTTVSGAILDMIIPVSVNNRDELGLIMAQNTDTVMQIYLEWEADTTVATGATVTGTVKPTIYFFEVPQSAAALPQLNIIHQIAEDQQLVPASGEFTHNVQVGGTIAGLYYYSTVAFTNYKLLLQRTNVIYDLDTDALTQLFDMYYGRSPILAGGAVTGADKRAFIDLLSSDGLGTYGGMRDLINTKGLTYVESKLQFGGTATLFAIRRQYMKIAPPNQRRAG